MMNINIFFRYHFLITISYYFSIFSFIYSANNPQEKTDNQKEKIDTDEANFLNSNNNEPPTYEEAIYGRKGNTNLGVHPSHNLIRLQNDTPFSRQGNSSSDFMGPNNIIESPVSSNKDFSDELSSNPTSDKLMTGKKGEASSSKETIVKKCDNTLSENNIYEEIKKSVEVKLKLKKNGKFRDFVIISRKTKEKIIENMESINYNIADLRIYKLNKSFFSKNKYFHEKVNINGSIKESIEIDPSELKDDITGDSISNQDLFIFYLAKIDISVNQLMELRKLIKKEGSGSIFLNLSFCIICKNNEQFFEFHKKIEESSVDILKYKIDGYTGLRLEIDAFYIEGGGADYYVNESTIKKSLYIDMRPIICEENNKLHKEIEDYKKDILKMLSEYFSRNFLFYIYDNYLHYNFRDLDSEIRNNEFEEKEFNSLYKEYLKNFHDYIQKNDQFFDCIKLKEKNRISNKKENDNISLNADFSDEIRRFEVSEEEYKRILLDIFHKNESGYFHHYFNLSTTGIPYVDSGKTYTQCLKDYLKTKKNDLIFEKSIREKCDYLLSKIEKDVNRLFLIKESNDALFKMCDNTICVKGVKFKIFDKDDILKVVKKNNESISQIFEFIFIVLRNFEEKSRDKLNINFYNKEIKALEPILESFEKLKTNVNKGIEKRKDLIKFNNKTLHFKHPKTGQICNISAKFNTMKRKEITEQHEKFLKEVGENGWVYCLSRTGDVFYYSFKFK